MSKLLEYEILRFLTPKALVRQAVRITAWLAVPHAAQLMQPLPVQSTLYDKESRAKTMVSESHTVRGLVESALSGSKGAFGVLYDRYFDYTLSLLLRKVGRIGLAKDLAQESFLQAYLCLRHLKKPESFKSWIHGIALNVHKEYLRDKDASHVSLESITGGYSIDAFGSSGRLFDPHEIAERTELRTIIHKAISSLSPNLKTPVVLHYYEQLSLQEISLRMNLSHSAVKSRLYRGRLFLREILYRLLVAYSLDNHLKSWRKKMVKAQIFDVVSVSDESSRKHALLLLDEQRRRVLPIFIGESEATAIALGVKKREFPRPMTYELIANLLEAAEVKVAEVQVESLRERTFYGVIKIQVGKRERNVDARPSDAIALAIRTECPILVSEEVMDRAGISVEDEDLQRKSRLEGIKDIMETVDEKLRQVLTDMGAANQATTITFKSLISDISEE
jgi:RNA polymerase sigma factor (sigma-70 family)